LFISSTEWMGNENSLRYSDWLDKSEGKATPLALPHSPTTTYIFTSTRI
jgi:hypothetical protein